MLLWFVFSGYGAFEGFDGLVKGLFVVALVYHGFGFYVWMGLFPEVGVLFPMSWSTAFGFSASTSCWRAAIMSMRSWIF